MDPLGALVIAFIIMRDGWRILWEAVRNLMDTAVSESELEGIRRVIESTPGILDYHELRTRRVGTEVLVDVHVRVEPRISISEGHNLQENLRLTLLCKYPHIKEVLVHLDTEPDHVDRLYALDRNALENMARGIVRKVDEIQGMEDLMIHYLDHKITLDLSVKMGDEITIGQCRSIVQRLERELLKIPEIEEVNVRCNLTGNRRPLEQPAPSEKEG
jgi:divalent metal cation (Fe/Co/Zn/Cd) transporter